MLRRALIVCVALLAGATACGGSGGEGGRADPTSSPGASVSPSDPTPWMQAAVVRWRNRAAGFEGKAFKPVRQDGKLWTGDARRYEKACGATFLVNGDTPDLDDTLTGRTTDDPAKSYYHWLQSDPARWGAFNAWLKDPAVVHALADDPSYPKDMTKNVGDSSACKDPSAAAS